MPEVRTDDIFLLLISSVRYAMGRQTYIVKETCNMVRRYRKHLREQDAMIIVRDVQREIDMVEGMNKTLGADFDHKEWQKLVVDLLSGKTDA